MKKLLILLVLLTFTGCTKEKYNYIHTSINKDKEFSIIEYPVFGIFELDNAINKDINHIKNEFNNSKKEDSELNIDFEYQIINENYISIIIKATTFIEKKEEKIYTYLFDKNNNKFIDIGDILNKKELITNIKKEFKAKYNKKINNSVNLDKYYIGKNYLTFYINLSKKEYLIQIPLEDIKFNFVINEKNKLDVDNINSIKKEEKTIDINKPIVALTFDDGPSKYTNEILDILKDNGICATFFVLGNKVPYGQENLLKMLENGNEIGNHTYNHKWLAHLDEIEIKNQISKTQEVIFEYTRYLPKVFRPSYGDIPKEMRKEINLEVTLWNVDTLDWKLKNKKQIIKRATRNTKDGDIILMHDTYKRTKDSLPKIINTLKKKGFQFVTISELNEIKKLREYNE